MALTAASPLFLKSAEDLLHRLEVLPSAEARALAAEAREIASVFRGWLAARPESRAKVETMTLFFDLNRRAMEFLSHQGPPASGGRRPAAAIDDDNEPEPTSTDGR
jgi:hypothetical protein